MYVLGSTLHYLRLNDKAFSTMPRIKDEILSIRTTSEVKHLLRLAADRERRSVASMIEVMVLDYAQRHKLNPDGRDSARKSRTL